MRFRKPFSASMAGLFVLLGLTLSAVQARAEQIKWQRIVGTVQTGDLVGVGTGQVTGAAPWVTTNGMASVDLMNQNVQFKVQGLVVSVGSVPAFSLFGMGIGTTDGVTEIKGTLVCNVSGTASGSANSVVVDTDTVPLDAQGDAQLNSKFSSIPAVCSSAPQDTAFLIRIVAAPPVGNLYIAFGAVRVP